MLIAKLEDTESHAAICWACAEFCSRHARQKCRILQQAYETEVQNNTAGTRDRSAEFYSRQAREKRRILQQARETEVQNSAAGTRDRSSS